MGMNLFHGTIVERDGKGLARLRTEDGDLWVVDPGTTGEVFAAVRPARDHASPHATGRQRAETYFRET
jgi:hypothetical protein